MKQRKIFLTGVFTVMLAMGGCMAGMAAQETETETEKEEWKAPEGFESPQEAAEAFGDAYIEEDAYRIVTLFAEETINYMADNNEPGSADPRETMLSVWQASFDAGDTGLESFEITECRDLTEEEFWNHFEHYATEPEDAARVTVSFPPCTDVSGVLYPDGLDYYCFTGCFDGLWYLVM